jgi:ABC-type transporter Mla MlaB component
MSENETDRLVLQGALRVDSLAPVRAAMERCLSAEGPVELVCGGLEQLDGAALQLVVAFVRQLRADGRTLTVEGRPGSRVVEALAYGGAADVIGIGQESPA